jgi:putative heme-binding domain-containing protein
MKHTFTLGFLLFLAPALPAADDPFAQNVRPTEPLTAAEQLPRFHVPEGFEIQLFASEPDIAKPMNMAFDEQGRMWLTSSLEYPYPVEPGQPARDTVKILSDTNGDGKADDIRTFADNLDIPIGVLPYRGGAIAWSIPNIWSLADTDGDGICDQRTVLYGPLGWRKDTHGMNNSFRRGFDGWMYLTHGFNNETTVRASDGSTLEMQSGHTYRVRPDGSHVDGHTYGQVNPFGLCFDSWGNLYSADCHSKPIYQLIRKGYYPSFGKPHDGLGFAPDMIDHSHNSTGIGGVVICEDERWPEEFRMNSFVGNVVTSRVNRDRLEFHGSSPKAIEMPDLVTCDDPWFRPVDLQMGPDGALYIADFYNRIIGHYEVPLDHPGRDRERGRIWRVVPTGNKTTLRECDLSKTDAAGLIAATASSNLTLRMNAMNQIVDHIGADAIPALKEAIGSRSSDPNQVVHALWALYQLRALDESITLSALGHGDALVRAHTLRALSEMGPLGDSLNAARLTALSDPSPFVRRAAADSLGWNPFPPSAPALVNLIESTPDEDTHLRHTARIALRENLTDEGFAALAGKPLSASQSGIVAEIASHLKSPAAAAFLLTHIESHENDPDQLRNQLSTIAPNLPDDALARAAQLIQTKFPDSPEIRINLLLALISGRPTDKAALKSVGRQLVLDWLASPTEAAWQAVPVPGKPESRSPWFSQIRASADGNSDARFLCSLPEGGERLTGILRSRAFAVPERLVLFLAGHDGFPNNPPGGNNLIRLVETAGGEILASSPPPRNDIAQRIEWDLAPHSGKTARLEIVDGDTGEAYAWLAAGRFDPDLTSIPAPGSLAEGAGLEAVARLARDLDVQEGAPLLLKSLTDAKTPASARAEVARTLAAFRGSPVLEALAPLLARPDIGAASDKIIALFQADAPVSADFIFAETSTPIQQALAEQLASTPPGAEALVAAMESGKASPQLLRHSPVSTKLDASPEAALKERVAKLAATLPPAGEGIDQLIAERLAAYRLAPSADIAVGRALFAAQCALCHQIGGEGKIVGPQLDGVGNRGPDRLLEDILDPNRHVDPAFYVNVLTLTNGSVLSGLVREAAGSVSLVDVAGNETPLRPDTIAKRQESRLSLMPPTFGQSLTPDQTTQLLAYLTSLSKN